MSWMRSLLVAGVVMLLVAVLAVATAPSAEQGGRTIAELQRQLRDPSTDVRARAAQALATFQHRAVSALTAALNDREYKVRASAAEALVKIGPSAVVPAMIKALESAEIPIRANAVVVLGAFGPDAKAAVPALARALKDENLRVRELAGEALNRVAATGPNTPVSFPLNCH
jgi:HEAT repeat protein